MLVLLEHLKDDPALYVRRSVANNLNDIGKDHPAVLAALAQRWLQGASAERRWVVQHALRSAVKRGEAQALQVLGFGQAARVEVTHVLITPARAVLGDHLSVAFDVTNTGSTSQRVLVDFAVHYVKANGSSRAKVFKLQTLELPPQATQRVGKRISLADMSTRKHYAGEHRVEALLNGQSYAPGPLSPAARTRPAGPVVAIFLIAACAISTGARGPTKHST